MLARKLLYHGDVFGSSCDHTEKKISPEKIFVNPCAAFNSFTIGLAVSNNGAKLFDSKSGVSFKSNSNSSNLSTDDEKLPSESGVPYFLLGPSIKMRKIIGEIRKLKGIDNLRVLIMGESGSGKELIARMIRDQSLRGIKPNDSFLNCSEISDDRNSARSQFHGSTKGSYTGSIGDTVGELEKCHKATLVLDEIQNLHIEAQALLLRFFETKELKPLGSNKVKTSDVRIICVSNEDLLEKIEKGLFREDLYSRIAGWIIKVPSLNERPEDIPFLARGFIKENDLKLKVFGHLSNRFEFVDSCENILMQYHYRANVRQLQKVIENVLADAKFSSKIKNGIIQITESNVRFGAEKAGLELKTVTQVIDHRVDEAMKIIDQIESIIVKNFSNQKFVSEENLCHFFISKTGITGIRRINFSKDYKLKYKDQFAKLFSIYPQRWLNAKSKFRFFKKMS